MALSSFAIDSMVRGYHVYKDVWNATLDEELPCEREMDNTADRFAVAVKKDAVVVGHVAKKISSICSMFIHRGGSIVCTVTGFRQFSDDLVQGGLEIPCKLTFTGDNTLILKLKGLIKFACSSKDKGDVKPDCPPSDEKAKCPPSKKKIKIEAQHLVAAVNDDTSHDVSREWLSRVAGIQLTMQDRERIIKGEKLDDLIINYVQRMLKNQFPNIAGLQTTLYQEKKIKAKAQHALVISKYK